jgi:hypothetical protein
MEGAVAEYVSGVEERAEAARIAGPAASVVVAVGLASLTLGILSTVTAMSSTVSSALTFSDRVGDLSGVTTLTSAVFFGSWAALHLVWRGTNPPLRRVVLGTGAFLALALVGTFPPFFEALAG